MKSKICGIVAILSFLWILGVAGNSDLGYETDFGRMCIKCLSGLLVFVISLKIGGYFE